MTGEGADEVLLGYFLFRETKIRRFWSHQVNSAWRGQLFRKLYDPLPQFRYPDFNEQQDFYRPFLKDEGNPHYAMAVRWANGKSLEYYLSPDMQTFAKHYVPSPPWSDRSHPPMPKVTTLPGPRTWKP